MPTISAFDSQPPSGGCVLKHVLEATRGIVSFQPPSGGCVLKLAIRLVICLFGIPAAFGRLCVETVMLAPELLPELSQPPSGGCVLKQYLI